MDSALLCHRLAHGPHRLSPLLRSFERTIASYLESLRQAEAFLAAHGKGLTEAGRADLEAFLGDLLTRRAAGTVATRYKVLRILYGWLEEEDEIAANPMARVRPPIVPEQPSRWCPRTACAGCWRPVKARASRSAAILP
jgi:site-specific recombinase XerC